MPQGSTDVNCQHLSRQNRQTDPEKYELSYTGTHIKRKVSAYLNRSFLGNICPIFSCNATFPVKINSQLNRRLVNSSSKASVIVCTFGSLKRKMPLMNILRVVMGMAIPLCRRYLKHKTPEEIQIIKDISENKTNFQTWSI